MKKYIFGVFAIALAVGASAFNTFGPKVVGDIYGDNGSGTSQYKKLAHPYVLIDCLATTTDPCSYTVTTKGALIVTASQYSSAQMATFLLNGDVTKDAAHFGVYTGN